MGKKVNTGVGPGGKFNNYFMLCCTSKNLFPGDFIIRFFIIQIILNLLFPLTANGAGYILKSYFAYGAYGIAAIWVGAIVVSVLSIIYTKKLQDKEGDPGSKIIKAANIYNLVLNILASLSFMASFMGIMALGFYMVYVAYFSGIGLAALVGMGSALVVAGCFVVPVFLMYLGQVMMAIDVFKAESYVNNTSQFHL